MDMLKMKVSTVLAIALTISLILVGIVGLILSYLNPVEWILPYVASCIDYVGCWVQPSLVYTSGIIETLNTNWLITLPTSLVVLSMGLLQPESRRNIRAFPRKVINAYRKVMVWRDKVFSLIERLNTESVKWKRTFNVLKSPYSLLRACGVSPQLAITFLSVGSVAGGGAIVNETLLSERSFSNGDAGIYSAPLDTPVFADQEYNTLRLDLGATSVGLVEIDSISLGTAYAGSTLPSGQTNVIIVGGLPAVVDPAFAETFLEVGTMYVDRWRCETLTITNSEIHKLVISGNTSDGQSLAAVAGVPRDRGINGGNRADDMTTTGGYYDQLKITSASSGVNGKVDVLRLTNIYSKGGGCLIDRVKAGTMEITLNEIGGDSDLGTKAFQVATSVIYKSFTNTSNVEEAMAVPAAQ